MDAGTDDVGLDGELAAAASMRSQRRTAGKIRSRQTRRALPEGCARCRARVHDDDSLAVRSAAGPNTPAGADGLETVSIGVMSSLPQGRFEPSEASTGAKRITARPLGAGSRPERFLSAPARSTSRLPCGPAFAGGGKRRSSRSGVRGGVIGAGNLEGQGRKGERARVASLAFTRWRRF